MINSVSKKKFKLNPYMANVFDIFFCILTGSTWSPCSVCPPVLGKDFWLPSLLLLLCVCHPLCCLLCIQWIRFHSIMSEGRVRNIFTPISLRCLNIACLNHSHLLQFCSSSAVPVLINGASQSISCLCEIP